MSQATTATRADIHNINHVGMAVRDLAATVARYEAMGFLLTPYSPHSAAWKPGDAVQPLGSGNRCVMFVDTYLEILASEDSRRPAARIANFLKRHQGAHIICFDSPDCEAVNRRLQNEGIETSGVIPLQRDIDTPEGSRTAKFERVQFAPQHTPEGYIQAARHLTPEYIYQPRYIRHPNGCTALSETVVIVDDMASFVRRYSAYLAAAPERDADTARFRLAGGTLLTLIDARHAAATLPGTLWPPIPAIAAVAFKTTALAEQLDRLTGHGITVTEHDGRLIVPAEEASGVAVIFHD